MKDKYRLINLVCAVIIMLMALLMLVTEICDILLPLPLRVVLLIIEAVNLIVFIWVNIMILKRKSK